MMTPKMQIVWSVLAGAKDCGDNLLISACRRVIVANRLARRADKADITLIYDFYCG